MSVAAKSRGGTFDPYHSTARLASGGINVQTWVQ